MTWRMYSHSWIGCGIRKMFFMPFASTENLPTLSRVPCVGRAGTPLVEAAAHQSEFRWNNATGTLIGFWSPGYLQTILVAGYHLHFLSADRRSGGHLLACAGRGLRARVARVADFRVSLPESPSFLRADLTRNPAADLDQAEKKSQSTKGA